MREKITLTLLIVFVFLCIAPEPVFSQLFEVQTSEIRNSNSEKYYDDPIADFFSKPENLEFFFQQFAQGSGKIVGGEDVDILDYPWQVSVQLQPQFGGGHFCGGTILSEEWIMTASHCLVFEDQSGNDFFLTPGHVRIRAGFTAMNSSQGNFYNVEELILHPNYTTNSFRNDIALIKLSSTIDLQDPAKAMVPVVTHKDYLDGMTDPGVMAKVSGWGALSFQGPSPNILQAVEVPIVAVSNTSYPPGTITADMILAGAPGQDACQGDSGGPLVVPDGNGWYKLAGVVSFGVGCGSPGYPGAYARVSYFENWISQYVVFYDPNEFITFHYEDFSGGAIPDKWINKVLQGPEDFPGWEWTLTGGAFGGQLNSSTASNGYLILDSDAHGVEGTPEEVKLTTPAFDFSNITTDLYFSVEHLARTFGNAETYIYMSTDDFETQTLLYEWSGAPQHGFNGSNPVLSEFNITEYAQGLSNVRFRFLWLGSYDYWWLIDDVKIRVANNSHEVVFEVTDGENPLSGALVSTAFTGQQSITDDNGIAELTLYEATYDIFVNKDGYFPLETSIEVSGDMPTVEITLEKIPAPEIAVHPLAIDVEVMQGFQKESVLTISNLGDAALEYTIYALPGFDKKQSVPLVPARKEPVHYDGYHDFAELQLDKTTALPSSESINQTKEDTPFETVEIHHDSGYNSGVGTGGSASFITAARFTADELASYYFSHEINAIRFHIRTDQFSNVEVKIWKGGSLSGPAEEIYSATVTDQVLPGQWTTYWLEEGIIMTPGEEYWFGYAMQATGGHPASVDAGPMVPDKGGWMFFGGSWAQLPELNPQLNFNWNIRGILGQRLGTDWLSIDPDSGTVSPDSETEVVLTFDAAEFLIGDLLEADLLIVNNAGETIYVPISMEVTEPLFNVSFDISDIHGNAVEEAIVSLGELTNEAGNYEFTDLPVDTYTYTIEKSGYLQANGSFLLTDQDIVLEVTIIPDDASTLTLDVSIEDEFNEPLGGVLFALSGFGSFMSDEEGSISITLVEGEYDYTALKYGLVSESASVHVTGDDQLLLTMHYVRYEVTLSSMPENGGTTHGAGEYYHGETALVSAIPEEFHHFSHWSADGQLLSSEAEYSFEVFHDSHLMAHFELYTYQINASAMPEEGGTVEGTGEYQHGDMVTITAIPAPGYGFVGWTEDGESIDDEGPVYTFEVLSDRTLVAHFELLTYDLTFDVRAHDMQPIFDAIIEFEGTVYEAGQYSFEDLLPGSYAYTVMKDGYFDQEGSVEIINQNFTHQVVLSVDDTSIPELADHGILIYPNPATNVLHVTAPTAIEQVSILDLAGRSLYVSTPGQEAVSLYVHELNSGMYMIRVITADQSFVLKFQKL